MPFHNLFNAKTCQLERKPFRKGWFISIEKSQISLWMHLMNPRMACTSNLIFAIFVNIQKGLSDEC